MVFGRNFCEKRQIWASKTKFGEVRGDARPLLMAHWKAHSWLFIGINWTFCAVYYGSGVMRRNVYSSVVFTVLTFLHSNFTCTGSSPSTILGVRKLETLGYSVVKTACLCVPSFWHNTGVWRTDRRTDRRICRSIYSRLQSGLCGALCFDSLYTKLCRSAIYWVHTLCS